MSRPMNETAFKGIMIIQNDFVKPFSELRSIIEYLEKENYQLEKANKVLMEAVEFIDETAPAMYEYNEVELRMVFKAREAKQKALKILGGGESE